MMGLAALAFASCSNKDVFDQELVDQMKQNEVVEKYNKAFIRVFGEPAANQTWGFGTVGTRAADTWDGTHTCLEANWEDKLNFSLPANAVQLDSEENGNMYYDQWYYNAYVCKIPSDAKVIYVSKDFNGEFVFDGNIADGVSFYNYGTITGFRGGNFTGTTTIYNAGTMTYNVGQQDHNIVNTGTLYVKDNDACAKILNLYNGGSIEFGGSPAQLHSKSTYYSNGKKFYMPNGGVIESKCDIHETITVKGDLNIQTGTDKKICGIEATGRVQNTAGRLEVSYIEAKDIYFEGNHIYLNPEGYLKAETMEFDKAACDVHAATGSNALVEVTKNISFKNDNDFNRTFSDNIYFKVDGSIDMNGQTNGGFTDADRTLYNSAADYIAKHGNPNNHLNAGTATGSPKCGNAWSVDTPTDPEGDGYDNFIGRVFAEDLSASGETDFDFNDVVFDVYTNADNKAKVVILAAGGTLPLTVAGEEVHKLFEVGVEEMVNTKAGPEKDPVAIYTDITVTGLKDLQKITIKVTKEGSETPIELLANVGEPAAKIAVNKKIDWQDERKEFVRKYEDFQKYVSDPSVEWY